MQVSWVQAVQVKGAVKLDAKGKVLADKLNQVEWKAAKRFALLEWLNSLQLQPFDQPEADTLSYLASLLYEAAVRLNLQIGDRSLHLQLPAYVSPGFDVFAATGASELSLYNPREFGLKLQLTTDNDAPVLTVLAPEQASWKPASVTVKQTTYAAEQADVVDRTLPAGEAAPRSDGRDGLLVEVIADGKPVSRDFYLPVPAIVGHGQSPEKQPAK
ncbi:MAG: VanW family protein [Paenibacillaceae bacterium]|nr:VanW family protein [Paenibacillaceae bacterium]